LADLLYQVDKTSEETFDGDYQGGWRAMPFKVSPGANMIEQVEEKMKFLGDIDHGRTCICIREENGSESV